MYKEIGAQEQKTTIDGLTKLVDMIQHQSAYRRDGGRVFPGHAPSRYLWQGQPIDIEIGACMESLAVSSPKEMRVLLDGIRSLEEATLAIASSGGEVYYVRSFFAQEKLNVLKELRLGNKLNPQKILSYVQFKNCSGCQSDWK